MSSLAWEWLGRRAHAPVWFAQRARRQAILSGDAAEVIWLVEHPPTVTVGRRPAVGTPTAAELAARGLDYSRTERGGLATWHGPGQLVAYPVVDLGARRLGVRRFVALLEDVIIEWLATLGVLAGRRAGAPGVWAGGDKIAAVGIHIRRGVSIHGLAVNITPDLSAFDNIVPCGITDAGVTSVAAMGGTVMVLPEAAAQLGFLLARRLQSH